MIDAFVRAPIVVPIAQRYEGNPVVIVSQLEVWPWRVVLRGVVANPDFMPVGTNESSPDLETDGLGTSTVSLRRATRDEVVGWRRHVDWMLSWTLSDETGSERPASTWQGGPSDNELWSDVALTFDVVVPTNSDRRLVVSHPDVGQIEVTVPMPKSM